MSLDRKNIYKWMLDNMDDYVEFGSVNSTKLAEEYAWSYDLDDELDSEDSIIWEVAAEISDRFDRGEFDGEIVPLFDEDW